MDIKPGDKLGRYQVLSPVGEGGMGEVWKARDTQLDRDVAVKVSKAAFTARFEREARAIAAFNHPNICQVHDVSPNYIVMELIEGVPLTGPMPVEKAVSYAGLILDALDAARHKGFAHRDLKPANILVTKQGLKLLDFGLAKKTVGLGDDDRTLGAVSISGQASPRVSCKLRRTSARQPFPPTVAGWPMRRTSRASMRCMCGPFPQRALQTMEESGRSRTRVACSRSGRAMGMNCSSGPAKTGLW